MIMPLWGKKSPKITYTVLTKQGDRNVNEDSVGAFQQGERYCFVLCDGLGGHGMGDVASSTVVGSIQKQFDEYKSASVFLNDAFVSAQEDLLEKQVELRAQKKMKTTAVVLLIEGSNAHIGYVGDSRGYWFHKNRFRRRTLDHSIPQMLVLSKEIKECEIRNHPQRSIVLRVMGTDWEKPMYELLRPISLGKNDVFLLCSDGFWELIEENMMEKLLEKAKSPEEWLGEMEKIILLNENGNERDNYSAIAVWCNR